MKLDAETLGLTFSCRQYGDHSLQRLGIWEFASQPQRASGYWIIFIHGGGWRDPRNTFRDFIPSIKQLVSSGNVPASDIRGFVSIDYRLSPHPRFPQDPTDTPSSELRDAGHPDHIQDVRSALKLLETDYQLKNNYILIGHSAGASLAFQLLMGSDALAGRALMPVPLPAAVIGIAGIYDIPGLVSKHGKEYEEFICGAFGSDSNAWREASPACYHGSFKDNWPGGKFAVAAWSPEDSLIDESQVDSIVAKLANDNVNLAIFKDLTGDHEFVWEDGSQVARLVAVALSKLSQT